MPKIKFNEHTAPGSDDFPTEMDVIAVVKHTHHCDERPVEVGWKAYSIWTTFTLTDRKGEEYAAYGRMRLSEDDDEVVIVAQFSEDVSRVTDLAVGDTYIDACGCVSIVVDPDELSVAFEQTWTLVDTLEHPSRRNTEELERLLLAYLLGVADATGEYDDEYDSGGDEPYPPVVYLN